MTLATDWVDQLNGCADLFHSKRDNLSLGIPPLPVVVLAGGDADVKALGGIGLGLAIARSWAMLLGGRVDLAARHHPKYGGAHFRLTITRNRKVTIALASSMSRGFGRDDAQRTKVVLRTPSS